MSVPKLRFKEFDGDWKIKKLGNSFNLISGYAFPSSASVDKGAKWLKIADVGIQEMTPSSLSYLPHEFLEKYPQFIVSKDDYVIALTRPILNKKLKIAKVGSSYDGALLNQRVAKIQTNENDLGFIYSLLQKSKTVEELENSISGTDPPNLSLNDVKDIRLGFPSIEEQTKIATFLSAVDEKISQLTQKHQLLSQYKQGMMQKLFSQQICFKADDGSEFGEWGNTTLDDVVIGMQSGLSRQLKDEDTGLIVLRSNNVIDNKISYEDVKYWYLDDPQGANVANYILQDGDILVNFINSMAQIGKSALYRKVLDRQIICTTNILRLQANIQKIKSEFLNYIFQTNEYQNYIQSITKPAVNQASFTTKEFKMMRFQLPCLGEQTKIANFLSSIDQKIEVVAQQIEQAKTWKKGLLQQMFV